MACMSTADAATRLSQARTRLILDKPFLGALALRLPLIKANPDWCKTVATDARAFYYNPQFINDLSPGQVQFMLAHEVLHCALLHFSRRAQRIRHCWDVACDYAINPLLLQEGLEAPQGILYEATFTGMSAEEIYPFILDTDTDEPLDTHLYDQDNREGGEQGEQQKPGDAPMQETHEGQASAGVADTAEQGAPPPPPLSAQEREALALQWQQRLAGAAQQASQAGRLSAEFMRLVDAHLQPRLPWRMLLARYLSTLARDDYSYTRPSSRRGEQALFPSLRSAQADVVIALDVSGSVSDAQMREFAAEIDAIKGVVRAGITLLACDAGLSPDGPWRFEPWEAFEMPKTFAGGGGTRFTPVFEWVARCDRAPDMLLYFTDAQGEFPRCEPSYPVLWLVKGKAPVPWGQRIQLN